MRNSDSILACFAFMVLFAGMSARLTFAFSSGPPDGHTGSPVDNNFETCNHHGTGCHNSYEPNTGTATFSILAPRRYTLSESLNVTVSFANSNTAKHGFELSALDASNNYVGTFNAIDGKTQTSSNGNFIKQTSQGSDQSGNAFWDVKWTAPVSIVPDPVTFYASGNEANGDGTNQGDYIYTTAQQISFGDVTPTPTVTPTPIVCEPRFIHFDGKRLNLKFEESKTVTVTVTGSGDCKSEGVTVKAVIKTGKNRIAIDRETATTDTEGRASFTITAGRQKGNAKILFSVDDSKGKVYKDFIVVKIREK